MWNEVNSNQEARRGREGARSAWERKFRTLERQFRGSQLAAGGRILAGAPAKLAWVADAVLQIDVLGSRIYVPNVPSDA